MGRALNIAKEPPRVVQWDSVSRALGTRKAARGLRNAFAVALVVGSAGCAVMTWSSFSYSYGPDTPCVLPPALQNTLRSGCAIEIPEFGYIAASGYAMSPEKTQISVWVVPRRGVTIRWSSRTVTIYHMASGQTEERAVLSPEPVTGEADRLIRDEHIVIYGRRLSVVLDYSALSREVEVRLPPLVVGDSVVRLLPIRVHESLRVPVPLIIPRT